MPRAMGVGLGEATTVAVWPSWPGGAVMVAAAGGASLHGMSASLGTTHDRGDWDEHWGSTLLGEIKGIAANQRAEASALVTRAQQTLAFVVAVFAVAQTAALSNLPAGKHAAHAQHHVLDWAIAAAVLLVLTALVALAASTVREYETVGADDVEHAADRADENDQDVAVVLAKRYQKQIKSGKSVIAKRLRLLRATEVASALTVAAIVVELVIALAARGA